MAIIATQKVLTLDYWKMASDITEGDILFDHNGEPVKVKLVQQYRSEECYEVVFDDGLSISGDKHLRLPVEDKQYRKQVSQYKNRLQFRRPIDIKTVGELYETPLLFREFRHMFSVPSAKPLQLPTQTLPVPPFVFGFWFYNHGVKQTMVPPRGTEDYVRRKFRDAGYLPQKHRQTTC